MNPVYASYFLLLKREGHIILMENIVVLIADDNWEIIESIATFLKKINPEYTILTASNGKMAFEIATKEVPDVIIMDWDMPVMNGIDAMRQLKSQESTAEIPVIIATGAMLSSENLRTALQAGAMDYVRKPIDYIELEARLNTALNIKEHLESIKGLLNNELELKNRKLSTTSMLVVEKNDLMQEFKVGLDSLLTKTQTISSIGTELKHLIKQVDDHLELDVSWDTFKVQFEEVHTHFFSELEKRYAGISHKDLKLCAYMRLGIENKEISRLLNITPASVSTSLYRLKKKLNVDSELDLRDFIVKLD